MRAAIADTQAVRRGTCHPTALDPYLAFVRNTLAQYPRLHASAVYVEGTNLFNERYQEIAGVVASPRWIRAGLSVR